MPNDATSDSLDGRTAFTLSIPDLDARLQLKMRSIVSISLPIVYAEFARHIDVASMRRRGIVSVISFAEFAKTATPLPVGGEVDLRTSIRLCDFAGGALGQARKRFGFEVSFELRARPGTGDPLRYRDVAEGSESVACATGTFLLAMLRPAAPMAERLLGEVPPECAHMTTHALRAPHPSSESLAEAPADFAPAGEGDRASLAWGLHNTDVNQNVFTGDYLSALEDASSRALHRAGQDIVAHRIERASLLFKRPFSAGTAASLDTRALVSGPRTIVIAGFHAISPEGQASPQASIVGRIEGRLRD